MTAIADALQEEGFIVVNQDYPSRQYPIEELSELAVNNGRERCRVIGQTIYFLYFWEIRKIRI